MSNNLVRNSNLRGFAGIDFTNTSGETLGNLKADYNKNYPAPHAKLLF
jgi:hypothetical protein